MKYEALIDSVKQSIATGISTPVCLVEKTFLLDVVAGKESGGKKYISLRGKTKREKVRAILSNCKTFFSNIARSHYVNFLILLSSIVLTVLLLIAMISFFLSQVLLPNPNQYVNDRGTLVFNQPLATEHYMFLLNSANLWADSGIEVIKGDNVQITASGSFYSDIYDLSDCASSNSRLRYKYFHQHHENSDINKYLLCPEKPFGTLLFRIERPVTEALPLDSVPLVKERRNESTHEITFDAPTSGILHFAVNDIVLTKDNIRSIARDPSQAHLNVDEELFLNKMDSLNEKIACNWFDDNCGELLINVKVTRNVAKKNNIQFYDKMFIYCLRLIDR